MKEEAKVDHNIYYTHDPEYKSKIECTIGGLSSKVTYNNENGCVKLSVNYGKTNASYCQYSKKIETMNQYNATTVVNEELDIIDTFSSLRDCGLQYIKNVFKSSDIQALSEHQKKSNDDDDDDGTVISVNTCDTKFTVESVNTCDTKFTGDTKFTVENFLTIEPGASYIEFHNNHLIFANALSLMKSLFSDGKEQNKPSTQMTISSLSQYYGPYCSRNHQGMVD